MCVPSRGNWMEKIDLKPRGERAVAFLSGLQCCYMPCIAVRKASLGVVETRLFQVLSRLAEERLTFLLTCPLWAYGSSAHDHS